MSQSQPEADNYPVAGVKRPKTEPETTAPDPIVKVEPDVKRQKIDSEVPVATQQQVNIVDIDPEGDLTIIFESRNTGFKFDSNVLKRMSPILYQECLTVRPGDGSTWTFHGVHEFLVDATRIILNALHANIDQIPKSMDSALVHNIVYFAKKYGMKDRLSPWMKEWAFAMQVDGTSNKQIFGNLCGLWITNELGLVTECKNLQSWAVFNLAPDGKGSIGDPYEKASCGAPVDMTASFGLSDVKITDRVIRLRSEALDMIFKNLKEVQFGMVPLANGFGKDGRIRNHRFGGHACSPCLDLWFAYLGKSLLRPRWLDTIKWQGFPSLSQATEAREYQQSLEELCTFIEAIQLKINGSTACSRKGKAACHPPQLVGRVAVQDLISRGLAGPIGSG